MATLVGANFFVYFTATDNADRVNCKLCGKSLMSNRRFNLKQHLKQTHKIQFHSAKPVVSQKKNNIIGSNEIGSSSLKIAEQPSLKNKTSDSFCDINTGTLASIDSLSSDSCSNATGTSILKTAEEVIQERAQVCTEAIEHGTTCEVNNSDDDINAETTSTQNRLNPPNNFVEPSVKSWKNICFSKDPNLLTDYNQRSKKKINTPLQEDPLDENASSSKSDNFKQWANKKKQLLEIEVLEMQNYKMKLELWGKEQQLNVICSKYTRDIAKAHQ